LFTLQLPRAVILDEHNCKGQVIEQLCLAVSEVFLAGSTLQSSLGCQTRAAELRSCTSTPCTCLTRRWRVLQLPLLAWPAGISRISGTGRASLGIQGRHLQLSVVATVLLPAFQLQKCASLPGCMSFSGYLSSYNFPQDTSKLSYNLVRI